jgi:hypothetical protein
LAPFPETGNVYVTGNMTFTQDTAGFVTGRAAVLDASSGTQNEPVHVSDLYETANVANTVSFNYTGPVVKGGTLEMDMSLMASGIMNTCSLDVSGTYDSIVYDMSK